MNNVNFGISIFTSLLLICFSADAFAAEPRDWTQLPNFAELRKEIGWRKDFSELCENAKLVKEISDAFESTNYERVLALSDPWLASCPVDIPAYFFRALALHNIGRTAEGKPHYDWFQGLIQSILVSGDAKSSETAYVTISISEEYSVLSYLRLKLKRRGTTKEPLRDHFTTEDHNGNEIQVWFNPAAHFARLDDWAKEVSKNPGNRKKE